jgi:hypothetical protein
MSDRGRFSENRKLRNLFALSDRIAGDVWSCETDRNSRWIEVRRAMGGQGVVLDFTRDATRDDVEMVTDALDNLTFLLALVARAAAKVREQAGEIEELKAQLAHISATAEAPAEASTTPPNYSAQAAILLGKPAFWRFLTEQRQGEIVDDKDSADAVLKALLGITSKKQLNIDDGARSRWRDLAAEFSAWERVLA